MASDDTTDGTADDEERVVEVTGTTLLMVIAVVTLFIGILMYAAKDLHDVRPEHRWCETKDDCIRIRAGRCGDRNEAVNVYWAPIYKLNPARYTSPPDSEKFHSCHPMGEIPIDCQDNRCGAYVDF